MATPAAPSLRSDLCRRSRFAAVVLCALLAPGLSVSSLAQSSKAPDQPGAVPSSKPADVTLRVWPHSGYGRIVFEWPSVPAHKVTQAGRALTVSFERPIAIGLEDIAAKLSDYATAARIGADGKSAVITLKAGIRHKSFASGNSVVVDVLPAVKDAKDPAMAAVSMRIGAHATFTRFVFDWPRTVDYAVSGNEIRFGAKGRFDLAAARRSLPPLVTGIDSRDSSGGTTVILALADGAGLRHFRTGMSVVVDVVRGEAAALPAKSKKARIAEPKVGTKKASTKAPVSGNADDAAEEGSSKAEVASSPRAPVAIFDMSGKATNSLAERLVAQDGPAEAPRPTAAPTTDGSPTSLLPGGQKSQAQPAASAIPVILTLDPAAAVIKFHWTDDVGAAIFERAGFLWAVFDREARFAFEGWDEALAKPSPNSKRIPEEKPAAAFVARPKFSAMPGTTVFRMQVPAGVSPRVSRDKGAWIVTLEREYLRPASGVNVEAHLAAAAGARLFIEYPDAGQAVAISDPEVGDRIWVVPLAKPEKGIGLARQMAEVELFATAQGIAGRAKSDDITFRTLPKGVEIASRQGLVLSGVTVASNGAGKPDAAAQGLRPGQSRPGWLFDFDSWRRESLGTFMENKHALLRAAAMAPPTTRNASRLELAQLYFAYDNLTDVVGLLEVIEQDEPELAQEPVFRAMRGAAHYRLGDLERAGRDLNHNSLDSYKESALWRAALAAATNDWVTASRYFSRAETILRAYPPAHQMIFGLLAAEASLRIGDVGLTKFHLDSLEAMAGDDRDRARINYLRGQLLAKVLDPDGAIAAWSRAISGPDRQIRVLAALARTDLQLEKEKISKADAVEEIEKLRFAWRGDELEFKVLRRLGHAYLDVNDYKNGLTTLRELATYFPKHPDADKVIDAMRSAFIKLYVDGAADKLAPLTALALYDQFRELTPEGEVGDKLIAQLAERLVAVDLLDRSATLLRHLIDQRLKGLDRFDAANRLALVYLLDRKPQEALDALAGQVPANIIPQWAATRRHLKARALAELARYNDGLALIAGDSSLDAEMLRAETFWKLRDWPNTAIAYDRIIKATVKADAKGANGEKPEAPLDEEAQRNVLSLAIAYALGRNQAALKDVRLRFLGRMAKGGYKESFDVVTAPSGNIPDDYRVISAKVAEVDQFRSFLKSYRDKLLVRGKAGSPRPGPSAAFSEASAVRG